MAKEKSKRTVKSRSKSTSAGAKKGRSVSSASSVRALKRDLDRLDRELVVLLNRRAESACRLAQATAGPDSGCSRLATAPDELSQAVTCNQGPLSDQSVRAVFRELVSGCRALVQPMRVAYLGPQYSYSHQAAIQRFGQSVEFVPVATIAAVFEAVDRGDAQFGLVPLENSTDGRIADTLEMFVRMPVRISGEVQLRIHHHLLGKGRRDQIQQVCSKPQALSQCRNWLSKHLPAAKLVPTASTTAAAELAAQKKGVAAIASLQAGVNYGLSVLAENLEDNPNNTTRFAVIGHTAAGPTGQDLTSLMFQLQHRPGALADAMAIFRRNRLNLTWIESFPLRGTNKEYLFFVELEGYEADLRVRRAISSLGKKTERMEVLGSYARTVPTD